MTCNSTTFSLATFSERTSDLSGHKRERHGEKVVFHVLTFFLILVNLHNDDIIAVDVFDWLPVTGE